MKKRSSIVRRLFLVPIAIYGLVTALIMMIQALIGESFSPIAFINTFAQILWLPALLLLPLVLIMRAWRTSILLLPAALAWIITFGDHFVPKAPLTPSADQMTFTFMTYNLLDDYRNPLEIVALIEAADADVVAVQELSPRTAAAFNNYLAERYPYQKLHSEKGRFRGLGILSKFPVSDDLYWDYDWMPVSLGHQRIKIDIKGQTLTVYNLHPIHPGLGGGFFDPTMRGREIQALLEDTRKESAPFMMNGDFNLPELSDDYHRITQEYGFVDAYRVRGWGLGHTFTHKVAPFLRLDYLFLGTGVDVAEIKVWPSSGGSDHRPVLATLVLK